MGVYDGPVGSQTPTTTQNPGRVEPRPVAR